MKTFLLRIVAVSLLIAIGRISSHAQYIDYGYPVAPDMSSADSRPVGGISGSLSVSESGASIYTIPISVPPGLPGMEPNISIVYNSQSGNGICGWGCHIGGLSVITRGVRDIWHDGAASGRSHDDSDAFFLDGARLIEEEHVEGSDTAVFYSEADPYCRVVLHGLQSPLQTDRWFSVRTKEGVVYELGHYFGQQLYALGNKVNAWYLTLAENPLGHTMHVSYFIDGLTLYPASISYGKSSSAVNNFSNQVQFLYEDRPDTVGFTIDGERGWMGKRLKSIKTGDTFRKYTLSYNDTGDGTVVPFSRLTSVTEENGTGESLRPTVLSWSHQPGWSMGNLQVLQFQPGPMQGYSNHEERSYTAADLNGDGLTDIIEKGFRRFSSPAFQSYERPYYIKHIARRDANGTISFARDTEGSFCSDYVIHEEAWEASHAPTTMDVDGDGLSDVVYPHTFKMFETMYAGFRIITSASMEVGVKYVLDNINFLYATGDVNNDGLGEIIVIEEQQSGGSYQGGIVWTDADNQAERRDFLFELPSFPSDWLMADMNSDGMADLVAFHGSSYTVFWNDGNWKTQQTPHVPRKTVFQTGLSGEISLARQGDFNGDGTPDLLISLYDRPEWYIAYGKGDGSCDILQACSLQAYKTNLGKNRRGGQPVCIVADFDGDGRSDVFVSKATYHVPMYWAFQGTYAYWLQSNGRTLNVISSATSNREADGFPQCYTLGDFNGDGLAEIFACSFNCYGTQNADEDPLFRIYYQSQPAIGNGKVNAVTDGYGNVTTIQYKSLTDASVYTCDRTLSADTLGFPTLCCTPPLHVVSSVTQSNGAAPSQTTAYHFQNLWVNIHGRGMLGFEKTGQHNIGLGTAQERTVTAWDRDMLVPSVVSEVSTAGEDVATSETTYGYNGSTHRLSYMEKEAYGFDGKRSYNYAYYNFWEDGSPNEEYSDTDDGFAKDTFYDDFVWSGGRYLPQSIITWQGADHFDGFSTETTLEYNDRGLVTRRTDKPGTAHELNVFYSYDDFGNLTAEQTTGQDIESITKEYVYDATHRFVVSKTIQGCQTDYTYDQWGNMLTETDRTRTLCPQQTVYTYDGWGRVVATQAPAGQRSSTIRGWGTNAAKAYYTISQATATPWVKTWYDTCGREVLTESMGPGDTPLRTATTYNAQGLPAFKEEHIGQHTLTESTTYDARGRVLSSVSSTGRAQNYSYTDSTVTCTENGRQYTRTYNSLGKVVKACSPAGTVNYTYGSHFEPVDVVAEGAHITLEYDDAGNRTRLVDPDAGNRTYSYDALGRLKSSYYQMPFNTTSYQYNAFGQTVSRTSRDASSSWTYPTASSDPYRGLLTETSCGSFSVAYEYDAFNRVTAERWSVGLGTQPQTYQYTYNSQGLLASKAYPYGVTATYDYDAYGNHIRTSVNGQMVWQLDSTDMRNSCYSHGGSITSSTMLTTAGLPCNKSMRCNGNETYSLHHEFNAATCNLSSRSGLGLPTETFGYDELDRLVSVSGPQASTIDYADNGNILYKTNMGRYQYRNGTGWPHAVMGVENTQGLMSRSQLNTTYNVAGKVATLSLPDTGQKLTIYYGSDDQRYKSVYQENGQTVWTRYYLNDLDIQIDADGNVRRFYYLGNDVVLVKSIVVSPAGVTSSTAVHHAFTDYQGNVLAIVDSEGHEQFRAQYDPWGHQTVTRNDIDFFRGYTGHEMLPEFGLINMNGRMYDPLLARFLSPDDYVQLPEDAQSFNRYTYCLNNPLKYTDPDEEIPIILIGALIGGAFNLGAEIYNGNIDNIGDGLMAFGIGAVAGVVGAGAGGAVLAAAGSTSFGVGVLSGMVSAAYSMPIQNIGNHLCFGDPLMSGSEYLTGVLLSGLISGVGTGLSNELHGRDFLTSSLFAPSNSGY